MALEITGVTLTGVTIAVPPAPPPPPTTYLLYGWGYNGSFGGTGGTDWFTNPVTTPPITISARSWAQLAGMRRGGIGLQADGTIWGWGDNGSGQLAMNTIDQNWTYASPGQIGSATDWASLAGGDDSMHALKTNGTLWGWGANGNGNIGDGTAANRSSPVQIGTDTNWASIAGGYSCKAAIKTNGTLWTWGANLWGQLGHNDTIYKSSPTQVGTATDWDYVAVAGDFMIGLKTNGTLWTWGRNTSGSLGISGPDRSSPVQIGSATNWTDVFVTRSSGQAFNASGERWAWGANYVGQLGNSSTVTAYSPILVETGHSWVDIVSFPNNSSCIGRKSNGTIWAWGDNTDYALGLGDTNNRSSPVQIGSDTTWADVTGINYGFTAIKSS